MREKNDLFADIVLINGKIYTMKEDDDRIYTSIAIKGNKIIGVGDLRKINEFIGNKTEIINLKGKMVLPSFTDSHIHPPGIYLMKLYDVYLYDCQTLEDYEDVIRKYIRNNPNEEIIYGSGWSVGAFNGLEVKNGPRKERLDNISKDKAIVLWDISYHSVWLNTKAFEVFNITNETSCHRQKEGIPCSNIIKNEFDELWGCIKEEAMGLIPKKNYKKKEYIKAFECFQSELHSYGITNIASISYPYSSSFMNIEWYRTLLEENKLKLRVGYVEYLDTVDYKNNIEDTVSRRDNINYNSPYFKIIGTKILLDGVIEGNTAYLIRPYEEESVGKVNYFGELLWDQKHLREAIRISNKNNLQVCIHCIGDGAAKVAIDTLEDLIKKDKNTRTLRNELIHLQLIKIEDIKRMNMLDLISSIQPYWQVKAPGFWQEVDYKYIGERAEYEYPMKSLVDIGVLTTGSSDCPVTIHPNTMYAIQGGVTRNLVNAKSYGLQPITNINDERFLLNKYEKLSVMEMIKLFTTKGAYATFREEEIGTIEVDKYADLVILSQNILEINSLDIEYTKVIMTFFDGELVYKDINK